MTGEQMRHEEAADDADGGGTMRPAAAAAAPSALRAWRARIRRVGKPLDHVSLAMPMAALLGVSLAFALFAMPPLWLAHASAAEPAPAVIPISPRAAIAIRLLVALVGGALGGGAVWALFHRLERPMREPVLLAEDPAAPRLRRWDAHPDAPSRRPISAAADLGAPLDEGGWAPSAEWSEAPAPAPEPQPPAASDLTPAAEPEPEPEPEPKPKEAPLRLEVSPVPNDAIAEAPSVRPEEAPALSPYRPDPEHGDWSTSAPPVTAAPPASAAALMARLEAALAMRPGGPASPAASGEALRLAAAELRRIGNAI